MTISSTVRRAGPFTGNGVATSFPFNFKIFDKTDVEVVRTDSNAAGAETVLVLDSDYSVQLNADQNANPGGTITYPISGTAFLSATQQLTTIGALAYLQPTDITNSGGFYPSIIEDALDRDVILTQQLEEIVSRAIVLPITEQNPPELPPAAQRANTIFGFDAIGGLELMPITASVGAGNLTPEIKINGVDFIAGTSTSVSLGQAYGTKGNLGTVVMAGIAQSPDSYSLAGTTLTFLDGNGLPTPIPLGVDKIWCLGGTTLSLYVTPDGSVTDAKVPAGANISAAKIAYQRAAVGAALRLLSDKLGDRFDARDFTGVVGDGVTDCTAGINAALAAMGPGVLIFPAGTFVTAGNHTLGAGQYIAGAGQFATQFACTSLTGDIFKFPNPCSGIKDATISGSASRTAGRHLYMTSYSQYAQRLTLVNIFTGIELNNTIQYVDDCRFVNAVSSSGTADILISGGNDTYISGVVSDHAQTLKPGAGLLVTNSGGAWVVDSDFIHCNVGVLMAASSGGEIKFMFFHNVACDTSGDNAWALVTDSTSRIDNCCFSQCWGASAVNSGFLTQGGAPGTINGLAFDNSRFVNNGHDGIFLQTNTANVTINGGLISGNSSSTINTWSGVHLGPNVGDVSLTGARVGPSGLFSDTQLAQIQVDAGSGNRISINGCNLQTANTPVTMGATGNNNTITGCTGCVLKGHMTATTDANGHVTVVHGLGTAPTTVIATVENDGAAIFVQASGTRNTVNFQLKFFNAAGASLANTAVTFNWMCDF